MSLIMNPEDLTKLMTVFRSQSEAVTSLQSTIQSSIDSTTWVSPAADQFRQIWQNEFVPSLTRLREALIQAEAGVRNSRDKVVEANRAI